MLSDSEPSNELELTVVREHRKPAKRGCPVRLTKRKFIKICHLVQRGMSVTGACDAESVTYQIFRLRVSRSPRLEERFRKAEAIRFALRREKALNSVMEAGDRSGRVPGLFLARR